MKVIKIVILGLVFLSLAQKTLAQEVSLSMSPSVQKVVARPGQSFDLKFTISNLGDPQLVSVKVVSFEPQTDGTIQIKDRVTGSVKYSLGDSDTVLDQPFFLRSPEKRAITLSVQVPQVIAEKDYYTSVLVQSQAPPTNEGAVTARAQLAVASNILLSVTSDGSLETKPRVVSFYLGSRKSWNILGTPTAIVQTGEKVPLILELSNQGRHLITAQGSITTKGLGPKKNLGLKPQTILSSSQSTISTTLPGFFFGPHTVSVMINFGPSSPIIYATTNMLVLPSVPMLIELIFIALLAILILLFKKRRS